MDALEKLARIFLEFPGIGTRQAKRFAFFLASQDRAFIERLRDALEAVLQSASICLRCQRILAGTSKQSVCDICADEKRDGTKLLILEKDTDFETVENTKLYDGYYFILGGVLPFTAEQGPVRERTKKLLDQITKNSSVTEIILACSFTAEGEHTAAYVKIILAPLIEKRSLKISELARGLSTGTELEYSDVATLEQALKNRS